ncbi:MAG TPA: transposase [Hanamia sp.]|nr:transposase [Hanamia sp.]
MVEEIVKGLTSFRQKIYGLFKSRTDATFELVDALSSNTQAEQIVELSLNPLYRRNYCSITRSVDEFYSDVSVDTHCMQNQAVSSVLAEQCPPLKNRSFHLFAVDCTSNERLFSPTLLDRSPVYTARPTVPSNKPMTIGHQYSVVAYLPEKPSNQTPPWVLPMSSERVSTEQKSTQVGMEQITALISRDEKFKDKLCVSVADSAYSSALSLNEAGKNDHQVHISRVRNNRNLPRAMMNKIGKRKRGRPKQYGAAFKLPDKRTWGKPAEEIQFQTTSQTGKVQIIKIEGWLNLTMRGKYKVEPFRLVRIQIFKENGERLFKRSLWLLTAGKKRDELSLQDIIESYRQRFDIEHFFRFGKTRLLLDKFQTPEVEHEEAWWQLAMLSYMQLYMARQLANNLPNPWEKWLQEFKSDKLEKSPSQVQKDFTRIISEIGTPAKPPKQRKKSRGRSQGDTQTKRQHHKVVYKGKKQRFQSSA